MPPIARTPFAKRHNSILTILQRSAEDLTKRSGDHGYIAKPAHFSPGVLFVFCLLGASLALLVWWLFIRRSGFIWRDYDWAEYKASVLRRPQERPDDAITVFSDGTARKGGPQGSSVGARTVVLGELDTTYTKSYVAHEKPWGPRDLPVSGEKKRGLLGSVWGKVEGSVWGRLRGGGPPDENDTVVQRQKSLRRSTHRNSRRHRSHKHPRHHREEPEPSEVSTQLPAPPLTDITSSSAAAPVRKPTNKNRGKSVRQSRREPSYSVGDDRGGGRYQRHTRTRSAEAEESSSESSDSSTDTSTDSSSDDSSSDDESEIGPSEIGMAKGNKVYHHTISDERRFWGNAGPVERNGGGAGGTYGGGAPALMPGPGPSRGRGYRAGSVGSLSSDGSVRSSKAGR
ncbi:hypothetical protein FN846DRAFT_427917 [Sphaerosporella brunnea]|uniref:Uncharacterized protein n=1 Tax=Sphaerosporella brunnea TaxID=1250544 RepID=A0A5J5F4P1_9PEZI|nr:hypothetical protein FN846DRAFT_427917 [Sphaerosporella brunnea]